MRCRKNGRLGEETAVWKMSVLFELSSRDLGDGLENAGRDLVWVAL